MSEEHLSDTRLEDLIYEIVPDIIDHGIIVSSVVVFEMISIDGKLMVSVLHNKKSSKVEIADMLISAYKNIGASHGGYMSEGMDYYEDDEYSEEDDDEF